MYHDKILSEVWRNRDAYAAEHGHDLSKIVADLQQRQRRRHVKAVDRRPPKQKSRTDERLR